MDLEQLWNREIGRHRCPFSPLITAISQICVSDTWKCWGFHPDAVLGHSTGELAAAYEAGLYSLDSILGIAVKIGETAGQLDGAMVHGFLTDQEIEDLPVSISSYNFRAGARTHVTLSGYSEEIELFLKQHPDFVKMKLPHPWHHPDYARFAEAIESMRSNRAKSRLMVPK